MAKRELVLFDTYRMEKVPFIPSMEGKFGMYVCGVTPYDYSHIGHARAYVAFDVLHRWDIIAERLGFMLVFGDLFFIPFTFSIQDSRQITVVYTTCIHEASWRSYDDLGY